MHAALVEKACPSIRRLGGSRKGEVRLHRFLRNKAVTVAEMAEAAAAQTAARARGRHLVVIQDTTEIAGGGKAAASKGFGPVGRGGATRGILAHVAVACDMVGGLLGIADAEVWTRTGGRPVADRARPFAEKESHRWLRACERTAERFKEARSITMVSDAESDIYELFAGCPERLDVVIRARHDRRLAEGGLLPENLGKAAISGTIKRSIPAAPGRKAREATLALRFLDVEIAAPHGLPKGTAKTLRLNAVDVCETQAPAGVTPVHWLLLTTRSVSSATEAAGVCDLYRRRFLIEELFRTLKTAGFDIEAADIADPKAFITLTAAAIIAAATVLQLVKARDGDTGQTVEDCFADDDKPLLEKLSRHLEGKTARQKNPHPPDNLAFAAWTIARLGGWTGYYGKPGPAVMRYGLDRYYAIKLGTEIASHGQKDV